MLVIEYVFEGHKRGYNFTSPTRGIDDSTLKTIWRQAMPRGQGWGNSLYVGARSLKCFPINDGELAFAEIVVTGQRDEGGRGGIRRAEIDILSQNACVERLRGLLDAYPAAIHVQLERKPTLGQWVRIVEESLPRLRRDAQIGLTAPYSTPADWQLVEAFILKVALSWVLSLRRTGKIVPFTTLALDYHDEMPLLGLPSQHPGDGGLPLIPLLR